MRFYFISQHAPGQGVWDRREECGMRAGVWYRRGVHAPVQMHAGIDILCLGACKDTHPRGQTDACEKLL